MLGVRVRVEKDAQAAERLANAKGASGLDKPIGRRPKGKAIAKQAAALAVDLELELNTPVPRGQGLSKANKKKKNGSVENAKAWGALPSWTRASPSCFGDRASVERTC